MRKFSLFIILVSLTLLQACDNNANGEKQIILPKDKGGVQLKLAAAPTKSAADPKVPTADEFRITFTTTTDSVVFESLFSELPYVIVLPAGSYNAVAQYGTNTPFSADTPHYLSQQSFNVEMGQTTYLDMKAVLNSFIVDIVYQTDFDKYFSNYYVVGEVYDGDSYTFANNLGQSVYFAPCKLRLILKGTLTDGKPYSSIISEFTSPGTELHRLKINILPKGHSFDISIDETVSVVDITSSVPDSWRPDMPAVPALSIATHETAGVAPEVPTTVVVPSILKLNDICIALDDKLKTIFNTKDTLRVSVAEDLAVLQTIGVDVEAGIIGKQNGTLNFARLAASLLSEGGVETQYRVNIKSEDFLANRHASNDVNITVAPPVFDVQSLAGLIRTKECVVELVADPMQANIAAIKEKTKWEISTDNVNFTAVEPTTNSTFAGLTPNTTYFIKANYRNGYIAKTATIKTEEPLQIPGSNLNSWSSTNPVKNNPIFTISNSWWDTRNELTNSDGGNYFYARMSGTKPITGVDGQGAELLTLGWGSGNTCALGGAISASTVKNISAALLFVGEYKDGEKHGKPFATKPSGFSFYYHSDPYSGDNCVAHLQIKSGDIVIGEGIFKTDQYLANFTQQIVDVTYDPQYYHLAPTTIFFTFRSGENEGDKKYLKAWVNYGGAAWSGYSSQGSKFYVDEIELIYAK